nr:MAG TPA: hypothetical protein [Caudoviricetes sp.]
MGAHPQSLGEGCLSQPSPLKYKSKTRRFVYARRSLERHSGL